MADQLKNMDWENMDKDNIDAATFAELMSQMGSMTVDMNAQFGTEDWYKEYFAAQQAL